MSRKAKEGPDVGASFVDLQNGHAGPSPESCSLDHTQQFPIAGGGHGRAAEVLGYCYHGFQLLEVGGDHQLLTHHGHQLCQTLRSQQQKPMNKNVRCRIGRRDHTEVDPPDTVPPVGGERGDNQCSVLVPIEDFWGESRFAGAETQRRPVSLAIKFANSPKIRPVDVPRLRLLRQARWPPPEHPAVRTR